MVREELNWRKSDVLEYIENRIASDTETQYESEFFEDYKWFGKFNKHSKVYRQIIRNMNNEWDEE